MQVTSYGEPSLKHRSTRAVLWTGAGLLTNQFLTVVTTAVLARLLAPSLFGLLSMAMIAVSLLSLIAELGLAQALIQRGDLEERHLSTTFWSNAALSLAVGLLTVAVAPFVATFFHEPLVRPMIMALAMNFFLGSFGNVHSAILQKEMDFKIVSLIDISTVFAYAVIVVVLALLGLGVWSLVLGILARGFIGSVLPWLACPWRPKFLFDRQAFIELFGFGANLMGTRVVMYLGDNVSNAVVGKALGTSPLAYYNMAFNLSMVPGIRIASLLTRVMFPAFSLIQDEDAKIRRGYLQAVRYVAVVAFPITVGIIVTAPELVRLVYGPKWLPVVVPLQILGVGGVLNALPSLCGSVQKAKNRPDLALKIALISDTSDILLTIVGVQFGLVGVSLAHSLNKVLTFAVHVWLTCSLLKLSLRAYLSALYPAMACSGVMGLGVTAWRLVAFRALGLNDLVVFLVSTVLGSAIYLLSLCVVKEKALLEMVRLFWEAIHPPAAKVGSQPAWPEG